MSEKQLCRHQGQHRRRGRRCSRHQTRDFSAAHGEDHGEAGCAPQPMEVHSGADTHLQPSEAPTPEQGDAPRRL